MHLFIRHVHPIAVWLPPRLYEFPISASLRVKFFMLGGRILTGHIPLLSIENTRECRAVALVLREWGVASGR